MPKITGLLETALYADDMPRTVAFYEQVLGLTAMERGKRLTALDAGRQGVLLICQRGASVNDMPSEDGLIPGHDGSGPVHMAFAIPAGSYAEWRAHLVSHDVAITGEVTWPAGGQSVYFNDPDHHVIELATPGLWPNY